MNTSKSVDNLSGQPVPRLDNPQGNFFSLISNQNFLCSNLCLFPLLPQCLKQVSGSIFPVSADQFNFICINTLLDIFLRDEGANCPFISVRYWEKQSHHFSSTPLIEALGVLCAELPCWVLWDVGSISLRLRWDLGTELWKPSCSEYV